ncbi:MAG: RNase P modulator RnpM [Dehalococcoidia bacterium]
MAVAARGAKGRAKRVPQRTCVGCRRTTAKRELVRVVATLADRVEVDFTGKKAGRGAYLCRQEECWRQALKKNRLDHALRTAVAADDGRGLLEYMMSQLASWSAVEEASVPDSREVAGEPRG